MLPRSKQNKLYKTHANIKNICYQEQTNAEVIADVDLAGK